MSLGVSGCFGTMPDPNETIDDVAEVSATVDDIIETVPGEASANVGEEYMLTVQQLGAVAGEYVRRVRLLTWAVVAIVAYLILKETV